MKQDVSTMTVQQIERELKDFAWEYIALSDRAQTDEFYADGAKLLDIRKAALETELKSRTEKQRPADMVVNHSTMEYMGVALGEPIPSAKSLDCGNCGVIRFIHGGILEACPNCGDDETDLSIWDDMP